MIPIGSTVTEVFAAGLQHHRAGRLGEAEACYRRVLAAQPEHTDSLHLLGVIAYQVKRHDLAVKLISQAIKRNDHNPIYFSNLGNALKEQGKLDEAIAAYRQAIRVKPDFADAHSNLGLALQEQGKLDEAIAAYRQAIGIKPDLAEAHSNLGNALKEQGKLDEAVTAFRQAIGIKSDLAEAYSNLGSVLLSQGKLDDAVAAFRQAIRIKPNYTEAHSNLGVALKEQGKLDEAIAAHREAISIKPDYSQAHSNLGVALQEQGKLDDAVIAFRQAIGIKPDLAEAYCNLGNVLKDQGKFDEAIAAYRQAIGVKPDYAEAYNNLGDVLHWQDQSDEAVACYRQALAIKPDDAEVHNNLGNLLRDLGRPDEARAACEKAIELAPRNPAFHFTLTTLKRFVPGDRQLEAMEAVASDETALSPQDRIYLHFALAKTYDDVGDCERSFVHLLQGNALKRQSSAYNEAVVCDLFTRIRQVFTPALMSDKKELGDPSPVPVFIVGMPRSGTTLIEQILASHPKVFGAGELQNIGAAVVKLRAPQDAWLCFPEAISAMADEQFRQFGMSYVNAIRARAPKAERITDKMPLNFRFAGLIHLALPNARIIHVRRDPLDTCLSCFSKLFTGDLSFSYDLGELGRFYQAYEALMQHWRSVLPSGVMIEVCYEDVIADLDSQARRIIAHCGLEWEAGCLSFHETRRAVRTASTVEVRQPIYRSSIGRWRRYEQLLGPLIDELGLEAGRGPEHQN